MGIDSDRFERPKPCVVCGGIFEHLDGCKKAEKLGLTTRLSDSSLEARIVALTDSVTQLKDQFLKLAVAFNKSTEVIEVLADQLEALKRDRQP